MHEVVLCIFGALQPLLLSGWHQPLVVPFNLKRMCIDAPGFLYARVVIAHVQGESLKAIAPLLNETVVNTRAPRTTLGDFSHFLIESILNVRRENR